jgi:aspartyl-tRNA(Asn)/glutamyl-tRNA(Gln) amidotransferase subunit A
MQVRTMIKNDFDQVFSQCDVLLTPTTPTTAFKIGEKADNPLEMYLSDIFTVPVNIAGLPGISIPCGYDNKGLPIGLQLISQPLTEAKLLKTAYAYEQAAQCHNEKPGL